MRLKRSPVVPHAVAIVAGAAGGAVWRLPAAAATQPSGKLLRCHKPLEIMCSAAIVVLCYV